MTRSVRHVSLHRIAGTELRVISDIDAGVIPIVQEEEVVLRAYAGRSTWPHRSVTLFVLQDLQPLVRQVPVGASLPPGDVAALASRPVVNAYDLTDLTTCAVFVNRQAMRREGYWDDALAVRGLLAHEHAHPLAGRDGGATRRLAVDLSWQFRTPDAPRAAVRRGRARLPRPAPPPAARRARGPSADGSAGTAWWARVGRLIALLAEKLCTSAPGELAANELAIRSGFHAALLHLDRRNIASALRSVTGRPGLLSRLEAEVRRGRVPPSATGLLMLIADMHGYLDLALETAAFDRAGYPAAARRLDEELEAGVFPMLEPEAVVAYRALREQYVGFPAAPPADRLARWAREVLGILAAALRGKGLALAFGVSASGRLMGGRA